MIMMKDGAHADVCEKLASNPSVHYVLTELRFLWFRVAVYA